MDDFVPSVKVIFCMAADEFDLDTVTRRIKITPTETRKRESFPPQSIEAGVAKTEWSIEMCEENCTDVAIPFERMLSILAAKSKTIRTVCCDYNLEACFVVVIHMKDGNSPEVVLSREIVAFAASINAEIGFDLYCYE
jgi:hypothetical protein